MEVSAVAEASAAVEAGAVEVEVALVVVIFSAADVESVVGFSLGALRVGNALEAEGSVTGADPGCSEAAGFKKLANDPGFAPAAPRAAGADCG